MSAHRIATWQEAVTLLFQDKIDVLEEYEATISSPSLTINIPAVARLKKEVSLFKKGVKFSRINVLVRDNFTCCYCARKKTIRELNYDHVTPRVQGGKTNFENIVTSCYPCNKRKGGRTPREAGMKMHFKPYKPKVLPMARPLVSVSSIPDEWTPYLTSQQLTSAAG